LKSPLKDINLNKRGTFVMVRANYKTLLEGSQTEALTEKDRYIWLYALAIW